MTKRRNYEEIADRVELSPDEDARIGEMIDQAERELDEARVSFRWGKEQLELVKQAASTMGVPYQTFIKLAVFEHAMSILKDRQAVLKSSDVA